jgi:REP element-mobilizing transposase RayT
MTDVPNRFNRRSVRLEGFDYSGPGAYFVTVVTVQRECLFGEVVNGEMRLNELGVIACDEWLRSAFLRPYVQLNPNEFVVMPNHVHGIIWIIDDQSDYPSRGAATLRPYQQPGLQPRKVSPNSLGAIVRAYKAAVTYQINSIRNSRGYPVWQRNYYEHIVRNERELNEIAGYISTNEVTWSEDPEYPQ